MFSELVDIVIARTGRSDRLEDAISFANQTIRSVQSRIFCHNNLIEDQIPVTADPFLWTNPINFQRLKLARYSDGEFPVNKLSKGQDIYPNRYYAGAGYIGFTGMTTGSLIDVAYYAFQPRLKYYAVGARPATAEYNFDTEQFDFTYYDLTAGNDLDYTLAANQALARKKVSNWILLKWREMIEEGTLTKVWKLCGETERATMAFSLFEKTRREEFEPTENEIAIPGQAA
jgi:hypothetical protein